MLKNYLKIAWRAVKSNSGGSILNLTGLSLGMTCVIFISLFISDELSFDRFHEKGDRIFRLVSDYRFSGPILQAPLAPLLHREIPEIESFTRFYPSRAFGNKNLLSRGNNHIFFNNFYFADPSFFEIFSFPIIAGNHSHPLRELDSMVLTRSTAERLFGNEDPIGRRVTLENRFDFVISAVMEDAPRNSHFEIDGMVPFNFYERFYDAPGTLEKWGNSAFMSYMLITSGADLDMLQFKIDAVVEKHVPPNRARKLTLQPLTGIHLHSHYFYELAANSDIRYIYVFGAVALLILLTAGINYVNLSTARALSRAREVGLRKVVGARRGQLLRQFLTESILMSELALVSAMGMATLLMPLFRRLTGKDISTVLMFQWDTIWIFPVAACFLGLAAGGIPALLLSAFQPFQVLSGKLSLRKGGSDLLRKILVTAQFTISIALIACTGILSRQMNFIRARNLGFNPDKTVVVHSNRNREAIKNMPLIAQRFRTLSGVVNASASSHTPGLRGNYRVMNLPGKYDKDSRVNVLSLWADPDFAETYQLEYAAGRDFSDQIPTDRTDAFVINETAARALGWMTPEEAVGRQVECNRKIRPVIGVVKDFHIQSLHSRIEPMILLYEENRFYAVSARIATSNIRKTLDSLRNEWEQILPHIPFNYVFVDDQFAAQYQADRQVGRIMGIFTLLTVAISCLGLFGLAVFSTERRIKEIGVRKVLGASTGNITVMLSRQFVRWVLLANLLAWPAAFLAMRKWLDGFAYRISVGAGVFLTAGGLALLIALVTVGFQSFKTASSDPVHALRHE